MFKWLAQQFTREEEDTESLGSAKGIQFFIDSLPVAQPARTVEAIGDPFEHARGLGLEPAKLHRALLRLDERAQAPLESLWRALFQDTSGRAVSETGWLTLARYYRNVYGGYWYCLEDLPGRAAVSDEERSDAILMACRAMHALAKHKLLLRLRYRDVDAAVWGSINALAAWAHAFGATGTQLELYPDSGVQTSVERELLIALLFEVGPIANLLPPQMPALDVVLRRFASHYVLTGAYRETAPFAHEPGRNQPPQRWLKGLTPRPSLQFFGIGAAYPQLANLRKAAHAAKDVPDWIGVTGCDAEGYKALLDLLVAHWSVEPPQRRQRRDRGEGEILATRDFGQVRRMIAASEYAKTGGQLGYQENSPYDVTMFKKLRFGTVEEGATADGKDARPLTPMEILQKFELEGDRQMTERWTVTDVSEGGMGAVASAHAGWARVGMLIGLRRPDSLDWQLAVLRRLSRTAQGKLSIGLQTIPGTTHCARVRFGTGNEANPWVQVAGGGDAYHDAIMMRAQTPSLLLPLGVFGPVRECMLSSEKRWQAIRLESSLERGLDFERVAFDFVPAVKPA